MNNRFYYSYKTPFGLITIECENDCITRVCLGERQLEGQNSPTALTNKCATELLEYFAGKRSVFDLAICVSGTEFQKKVWSALDLIPYGQTTTPRDLAQLIGRAESFRAVGVAVKDNPIAIIIPAHRVVLSNGYIDKKDKSATLRAAFRELEKKNSL